MCNAASKLKVYYNLFALPWMVDLIISRFVNAIFEWNVQSQIAREKSSSYFQGR